MDNGGMRERETGRGEERGLEVGGGTLNRGCCYLAKMGPAISLQPCEGGWLPNPSRRNHTRKNKDRGHLLMEEKV